MRRRAVLAAMVLALGCSEDFNPIVEGERPYVVFALLNTSTQTQIVRVHETAPPGETLPGNPTIPGTMVQLLGPGGLATFRDTLLLPPAGSVDSDTVRAFVLDPYTPLRGETYTLRVSSPRGNASAMMIVPGPGDIVTTDFFVLRGPYVYAPEKSISLRALLSPQALGYVIRLLIEYERLVGGTWVTETIEVPGIYRDLIDETSYTAEYPSMERRTTAVVLNPRGVRDPESTQFRNSVYLQTLAILYRTYGRQNLRTKRALIVLTQADTHFFTYYSFANFFQDNLSIRVDQPDYTNMNGALGFFGSMTTDTLAYALPPDLSPPLQ